MAEDDVGNDVKKKSFTAGLAEDFKAQAEKNKKKLIEREADKLLKRGADTGEFSRDTLIEGLTNNRKALMESIEESALAHVSRDKDPERVRQIFGDPDNPKDKGVVKSSNLVQHGDSNLKRFLGGVTRTDIWNAADNQLKRSEGNFKALLSPTTDTGYGVTKAQLANYGRISRAGYALKSIGDLTPLGLLTGSGQDMLLSQMGGLSHTARVQMASGGLFNKLAIGGMTLAGGAASLYMASQSDNPANEYIANITAAYGLQAGWRAGKAVGSVIADSHFTRIGLGVPMALGMGIAGYAGVSALGDLTKSESAIVDTIKKWSTKEAFTFAPDTKVSATMRQRALQKLSASAMNSRGQLLGNEAMILRGAPMS